MLNPVYKVEPSENDATSISSTNFIVEAVIKNEQSDTESTDYHCHIVDLDDEEIAAEKFVKKQTLKKLIFVICLCFVFMIAEIIGGIIAHSISIQTDAAHMASDISGFFFSVVAVWISDRRPTKRMSFGYYRSEIIGALLSILVIWILTAILVYLAVLRVIHMNFEIEPIAMVSTAAGGVGFNIIMLIVIHCECCFGGAQVSHGHSHGGGEDDDNGHGHSHGGSHGHSHENGDHSHVDIESNDTDKKKKEKKKKNINLRAAMIHVIGDFIQSVGVLTAALIILIGGPKYKIADPICTFLFSIMVFATTCPILKDIFFVLMEGMMINNVLYKSYFSKKIKLLRLSFLKIN
jgi:solute carrier family 30 (zinc transporter), member 2